MFIQNLKQKKKKKVPFTRDEIEIPVSHFAPKCKIQINNR